MPDKIKLSIVDDQEKFLESIAKRLEMRDFDVRNHFRNSPRDGRPGNGFRLVLRPHADNRDAQQCHRLCMAKDRVTGEQPVTLGNFFQHGLAVLILSFAVLWLWTFLGYWRIIGF